MSAAAPKWMDVANNTHPRWHRDPALRMNVFYGLGMCLLIATNGFGGGLMQGYQAIPAWQKFFNFPKGARLGLYSASYFLPSVPAAFLGDWISTKYGRRACIAAGMAFVLVGTLINALAINVGMWIGGKSIPICLVNHCTCRATIGVGIGMSKVAAPVLIQEIAHPRLRPILGSCYQTFAYIGTIVAALLCFAGLYIPGNWSWRYSSLVQILGPAMILPILWFCPESPRWLMKQGKLTEAHQMLAKYHANGDMEDPLVQLELREINAALDREAKMQQVSFMDFTRTPGNRKRLGVLILMAFSLNWMGNGIISYYLAPILRSVGIKEPIKITLINVGLAIFNLIVAVTSSVNVDRFGRRPLFLVAVVGMFLTFATIMGLSAGFAMTKKSAIGAAVVPFLFIYFGFYSSAFTPLPVAYTVEIMPFNLRSKGVALFTAIATLGNAFNQFVNPIALGEIGWKYYAVYLGILSFYFVIIFLFFPETKRMSAEDASVVFDQPHRLGGGMFEGRGRGDSANDTEAGVVDMDDAGSDVKGNDVFVDEQKRA